MKEKSLSGQTGIVTGASAGIGRAISIELARRGMKVALAARGIEALSKTLTEIHEAGGEGIAVPVDVTREEDLKTLVHRTTQELGGLDLLVNNAGRLESIGPTWEADTGDWWGDVEVNFCGVFLACRIALPEMKALGGGRIVNMTGGGAGGPFPFVSAYAASKAAVVRFTENLQVELEAEDFPVKMFTTSPGFVRTAMTEQFEKTETGRHWMDYMVKRFEEGADVKPEQAAGLIAAIAEGRLDSFAGRYLRAPDDLPRLEELEAKRNFDDNPNERLLRFS